LRKIGEGFLGFSFCALETGFWPTDCYGFNGLSLIFLLILIDVLLGLLDLVTGFWPTDGYGFNGLSLIFLLKLIDVLL
jgi:hypothetical protein